MRRFLHSVIYWTIYFWPTLAGIALGLILLAHSYGCASRLNAEAAAVLNSPDPCFVIARDPQHVTCLHGARPVDGHPQYRGRLP